MKSIKKLTCAALTAVISLSSVAALAAVPTPKDNVQAFIYAENYFNQGLYYEAKEALSYILPIYSHEADRLALWNDKVNERIMWWEVQEIFNDVKDTYEKGDVIKARGILSKLDIGEYSLTAGELAKKAEWQEILSKLKTDRHAIVAVENYVQDILWDPNLYYSVVKVSGGFDVYVKSVNSRGNVAAYHVDEKTGEVTIDRTDWNGNPAAEYQYR